MTPEAPHPTLALIALGGNLGDVPATFRAALEPLGRLGHIVRKSGLYRTPPWGHTEQPDFINAVLVLETALAPHALLEGLLGIERQFGRQRLERWGPRTLDLDLLSFGAVRLEDELLTLPHPRMLERAFVLCPLLELDPGWGAGSARLALDRLDQGGIERTALEW